MSFSNNDPQNPNPASTSEDGDVAGLAADTPAAMPLPPFDRLEPPPLKALADTLPELEAILRNEPPPAEPLPPRHVYQISPAGPDWSTYTMPPLEDTPPEPTAAQSGWKTAGAVLREIGETIILTLIIFFLIQTVIRNFRVVGTSMVDNLHDGQYLIIDKLSYSTLFRDVLGWSDFEHGDVIVFEPPNHPGEDYVKRVVGLPGETVEVRNGQVLVNGQPLPEPFRPRTGTYTMPLREVPAGNLFVLGDNRNNSNDSHNWGALPIENIVGRAWVSYWPPESWGVIPRDAPTAEATLKHLFNGLVPNANAGNQ
jgi:signal peptidase I